MNRHIASAANEFEADIVLSRLAEAGIHAWPTEVGSFGRGGGGGPCDVYVDEADFERARRVLAEAESVNEAELDALAERSAPPPD